MADDAPDPLTTYLTRVATGLRLSDSLDREVVEEIAGHLDDATRALEAEGLARPAAEREALARLGDPDDLVSGLRQAHQTRRRLLAAAGYGVVAALNGAFWAYLLAVVVTIFAGFCGTAIMIAIIRVADTSVSSWGATSLFAIPTLWFMSAYAGRATSDAVARRSFRDRSDVAPWIAVIGAGLIAFVTVFWWRGTLDPALVIALVGTPVLFAIGALVPTARPTSPGRVRAGGWRLLLALAVGTGAFVAIGLLTLEVDGIHEQGDLAVIGSLWPGTLDSIDASGDVVASSVDAPRVVTIDPPTGFAGLRDLRLEAWPLTSRSGPIDPAVTAPLAIGSLDRVGPGVYQGVVPLEPLRQTAWYQVATTGLGIDGVRYIIGTDSAISSPPWVSSVWEWLTAG